MVLVPFGPLRWYRLVRYDGTDCSATVVPIRPIRWYRLTDTIIPLQHHRPTAGPYMPSRCDGPQLLPVVSLYYLFYWR